MRAFPSDYSTRPVTADEPEALLVVFFFFFVVFYFFCTLRAVRRLRHAVTVGNTDNTTLAISAVDSILRSLQTDRLRQPRKNSNNWTLERYTRRHKTNILTDTEGAEEERIDELVLVVGIKDHRAGFRDIL